MTEEILNIIHKSENIMKKYKHDILLSGSEFNIFDATGILRKEIPHSLFIFELLNPNGKHGQGLKFLKLFLETLGVKGFDMGEIRVHKEFFIEGHDKNGRIDILIESVSHCLPVEIKLDARDQKAQVRRYYDFAKTRNKSVCVYFVTLEREPSENSCEDLRRGIDFKCIYFGNEINMWLKHCALSVNKLDLVHDTIKQYQRAVAALTNTKEDLSKMVADEIYPKSQRQFQAICEIANALKPIMSQIIEMVLSAIQTEISSFMAEKGYDLIYDCKETAHDYYRARKKTNPRFLYEIKPLDETHSICVMVEIDWNLCLTFFVVDKLSFEKNAESISFETYKNMFENIDDPQIQENYNNERLFWKFLISTNGEKFDFMNFNGEVSALFDNDVFQREIFNIADNIKNTISKITV